MRHKVADYLCYTLLDIIVDHYFEVIENLGDEIELLEEEIIRGSNKRSLAKLNALRKEMIVLKRNVSPVRELVNGFIKSESDLLGEKINKYFKDVYDHIIQANDVTENYIIMLSGKKLLNTIALMISYNNKSIRKKGIYYDGIQV